MRPRTVHRLRYALRLVASVFLMASPCGGQPAAHVGAALAAKPLASLVGKASRLPPLPQAARKNH